MSMSTETAGEAWLELGCQILSVERMRIPGEKVDAVACRINSRGSY